MKALLIGGPLDMQVRDVATDIWDFEDGGEKYQKQAGITKQGDSRSVTNLLFLRHSSLTAEQATQQISRSWDKIDSIMG